MITFITRILATLTLGIRFVTVLSWIPLTIIGMVCVALKLMAVTSSSWFLATSPWMILAGLLLTDLVLTFVTRIGSALMVARHQRENLERMYREMRSGG